MDLCVYACSTNLNEINGSSIELKSHGSMCVLFCGTNLNEINGSIIKLKSHGPLYLCL